MNTESPLRHPISTLAAPNPGWGLPFARRRCPMACRSTPERSPAITARSSSSFTVMAVDARPPVNDGGGRVPDSLRYCRPNDQRNAPGASRWMLPIARS